MKEEAARPPMVGVLTADLADAYQAAVWRGIESQAERRGLGVLSFIGSLLGSPSVAEAAANVAHWIAGSQNVDGLIVITSAISTHVSAAGVRSFLSEPGRVPQVSLGVQLPGIASVTVDGSEGVGAVIRHLVEAHGRRRFALLGGPAGHAEAEDRRRAFERALAVAGIAFDERLHARGTFLRESGATATRRLLATGIPFDALVCMNDRMAIGALQTLGSAGIRVPADVALVGFDGIEEGRSTTPPLTTVEQPLEELGATAVDLLCRLLNGEEPADRTLVCRPVFRESCGCLPKPERRDDATFTSSAGAEERREVERLAERLAATDSDGFIAELRSALAAATAAGSDVGRWNDVLSAVRRRSAVGTFAELLDFAREFVGATETRLQAARRIATEERFGVLRSTCASIAGAFELPEMLRRLKAGLDRLGMHSGYLVLFDDHAPDTAVPRWSRLLFPEPVASRNRASRFPTRRILPDVLSNSWRSGRWVLQPLVFQEERLGYMMLAGRAEDSGVYGSLAEQVASALKGALLLERVRGHERGLEDEVARRTGELTRANEDLRREIDRRVRLEEEVVDISNRTMQRIGQDIHDDLCQHLAGIAMLGSVVRSTLPRSSKLAIESVERINELLADSIVRAKQIARGLVPTGLEAHGLAAAVEALVEAARRSHTASIEFRASPGFSLTDTDRALQVYRIVQEALSNALKHSGSERIEVALYDEAQADDEEFVVAEVSDYGSGLPSSTVGDGMGLRIMRYRAEKAGADLRIQRLEPGTRVSCTLSRGGQR